MIESLLLKFMWILLDYFTSKATKKATEAWDQLQKDKEKGEINNENAKAYVDATSEADRIAAAYKLLNRTR